MNSLDDFGNYQSKGEKYPTLGFGTYTLEVIENSVIPVKKGKGEALLRAFTVLESAGEGATPVGTAAKAKLLYLDQEFVEERIGEYVAGLTGIKQINGAQVKLIFNGEQESRGMKVRVTIEPKTAKNSGKEYHLYTWSHVPVAK